MSNKITNINNSQILDNKLAVILEDLNNDLKDQGVTEREIILVKFNEILNKFYKTLNSPILKNNLFRQGTVPNYKEINKAFQEAEQDLKILYKEINSLESFIISNFNTLNAQGSNLRSRLRKISSDLADFQLYAMDQLGGATYFSDSFQNTEKIDYSDRLYDEAKCSIDIQNGTISLPVNTGKSKTYSVSEIAIGSGSNGSIGNNQEINALLRGELKSISDSNPDTWLEYERVSTTSEFSPLILELKFTLDTESIVNVIDISSVSFATKKYPRITKIETSLDGKAFSDITSQIPSSVFFSNTKEKAILLDPSSGKFSGLTKIKIPPTKIKYLNVIFQQDDSYIIKTPSGVKYRKAVGIRDLTFKGEAYEAKGEICSSLFNSPDEIKKVSVVSQKIITPGLTDVEHYVSIDDGQNWHPIQSIERISKDVKEILTFNISEVDSIATQTPPVSIRHKALLSRTPNGFSTRGGVEKTRESKSDFLNIAPGTQTINLTERPISSTVKVKNVSFGSVGGKDFHLINTSNLYDRDGFKYAYLPESPFYSNSIKVDQELIKIDNEIWSRTNDISLESSSAKVYQFDYLNNIIKFGDDTTGKKPTSDIFLGLKKEQVSISIDAPRVVKTRFDTDGVLSTTNIYRLEKEQTKANIILIKGTNVFKLNYSDLTNIVVVSDLGNIFVSEKDFIDGATELSVAGDYSVDYSKGIVYSYTVSPEDSDTVISITYNPKTAISGISFLENGIEIPESQYKTESFKDTLNLASSTYVVNLSKSFIEPKSLRFLTLSTLFKTEVPFIGDGTEFELGLSPIELDGYYTVDYVNGKIYTYTAISGALILEYNVTNYYAEYNIAVEIPRDDYAINEEDNTISFTEKYIIKNFTDSLSINFLRSLFKIDYDFVVELQQNPRELEPFFSPLLNDYALAIITRRQL